MTRCPICSGTKSRLIIHLHDHFCSGEEFSLYECLSCHVVSTWPIPDADNIQRYYSGKEYISHKTSSRDPLNKLLLLARRITMYLRRRLVEKNIPLPGSLLDIGCGTGAFLSEMMAAGWQVDGIEADAAARQTAEQNLNIAIQPPDKLYTLTKTYDAVTLWHVLEHMQNLPRLVIQFKKMLAPSGELFIAVPNLFSKDAKAYGPFWAAFDVPRHLYHFSPAAMENLFRHHGFRLIRKNRMPLDAFYISFLSERYKSGFAVHPRAFITAIRSTISSIFFIDTSSSLLYVFRKTV